MFNKTGQKLKIFLVITIVLSSINLFANETHDGFFLRGLFGGGYGETVEKDTPYGDLKFSGNSQFGLLQIGGALTENLILFAEQSIFVLPDPDIELGAYSGSIDDSSMDVNNFGIGATYYFMPINFYISGSLCASKATLTIDGDSTSTEWGYGTNVIIGKEWWVSANWGLGIAGIFHYSKMEGDTVYGMKDVENKYFGIAFSATYN